MTKTRGIFHTLGEICDVLHVAFLPVTTFAVLYIAVTGR